MEFLQNILDNTSVPVLYAFILGLMTAISPCPLATNITAVAFISQNIEIKRKVFINGILYTLGRSITYFIIALVLYLGASKFHIASFIQRYGERSLGPILIIIGIFMLGIIKIKLPGIGKITEKYQNKEHKGSGWSALLMGILFALAFCPYSGVLYFGMLIPMTISSASGLILPVVFAIGTGLFVIIFAYLIAFAVSGVGKLYNKIKIFEKWFRVVVAIIFIIVGFYYLYTYYIN